MKILRVVCAVLLALPLLVFGSNYFVEMFPLPNNQESAGEQLLQSMRDGGLMASVALSHVIVAVLLLIPYTRFVGALMQLPISLGIVAFHAHMLPAGLVVALVMLVLNLGALANPAKLRQLCE